MPSPPDGDPRVRYTDDWYALRGKEESSLARAVHRGARPVPQAGRWRLRGPNSRMVLLAAARACFMAHDSTMSARRGRSGAGLWYYNTTAQVGGDWRPCRTFRRRGAACDGAGERRGAWTSGYTRVGIGAACLVAICRRYGWSRGQMKEETRRA